MKTLAQLKKNPALTTLIAVLLLLVSCQEQTALEDELLYQENQVALIEEELYRNWEQMEDELLVLMNDYRASIGLGSLTVDETTYQYAKIHNEYMISEGRLSHDNFSARARNLTSQTGAEEAAENVARNYSTAQAALEAWLSSEGHRRNIEGNYNYTGISIKTDPEGNFYFTQIFLRK